MGVRNAYSSLVGNPEGERLLGRPRCGWNDNIKMDLKETVRRCGLDALVLGPMASSCEHGNEPSGSIKSGEFFD
jgi:hypothetical protein